MYRNLDATKIVETCRASRDQIAERFAGSGLSHVAEEVHIVSTQAAALSAWLARPHLPLRAVAGVGILAVLVIVLSVGLSVKVQLTFGSIMDFLQGSEAAISEVVFVGVTVLFFLTL